MSVKTVKLYEVPYGHQFTFQGVVYEHTRGDGMYPWITDVRLGTMSHGYVGMEVLYNDDQSDE